MPCPPPADGDFERRFTTRPSGHVRRWSLDKQNLLLQNEQGRTLLRSNPPHQSDDNSDHSVVHGAWTTDVDS